MVYGGLVKNNSKLTRLAHNAFNHVIAEGAMLISWFDMPDPDGWDNQEIWLLAFLHGPCE